MKKLVSSVGLIIFLITLSSCGHMAKMRDKELYTKISATNDTLDQMTHHWHKLLNDAVRNKSYTGLRPYRIQLAEYLSRTRNNIADMEVNAHTEALIDSELSFLSKRAVVVTDVYPKFELYNELTPDDVVAKGLKILADDADDEASGSYAMKHYLKVFAVRNGIMQLPAAPQRK